MPTDDDILGKGTDIDEEGDLIGSGKDVDDVGGSDDTPDTGGAEDLEGLSPKLRQLMVKKGFKSLDDLAEDYEKTERSRTKLRDDVDRLSIQSSFMPPAEQAFPEVAPADPLVGIDIPDDPSEIIMDKAKGREFFKRAITQISNNVSRNMELKNRTEKARSMYNDTMKVIKRDPQKFQRLRPTMVELSRQHPTAGVEELYNLAGEVSTARLEADAELVRNKALEGIPTGKLNAILAKSRPAHIAGAGGGAGADDANLSERQKIEKKIKDSILSADRINA